MSGNLHFEINRPVVLHETIDGEAIILNMRSGNYFSLDEIGSIIWDSLEDTTSVNHIVSLLKGRYQENGISIENAVHHFFSFLEKEYLVFQTSDKGVPVREINLDHTSNENRKQFTSPKIEKYDDMQELLLMDPIHEVDESGWPNPGP